MPTLKEQVETLVANLVLNEARADVWVNGTGSQSYTATDGVTTVPSIRKFIKDTFNYQGAYSAGGTDYTIGQTFKGASAPDSYKMFRVTANFTSTTFGGDSASYETIFDFSQVVADAETAQAAAEAAQAATEAVFDSFDDRYLGVFASDPTQDNDGNPLADGAIYWNTTINRLKFYDLGNTVWVDPTSDAADQAGYAEEWANKAEDSLVSAAAGGDGVDDYSAKHWAKKSEAARDEAVAATPSEIYDTLDASVAVRRHPLRNGVYSDGTTVALSVPQQTATDIGTSDFTVMLPTIVLPNWTPTSRVILWTNEDSNTGVRIVLETTGALTIEFGDGTDWDASFTTTALLDELPNYTPATIYASVDRNGSCQFFLDGIAFDSVVVSTASAIDVDTANAWEVLPNDQGWLYGQYARHTGLVTTAIALQYFSVPDLFVHGEGDFNFYTPPNWGVNVDGWSLIQSGGTVTAPDSIDGDSDWISELAGTNTNVNGITNSGPTFNASRSYKVTCEMFTPVGSNIDTFRIRNLNNFSVGGSIVAGARNFISVTDTNVNGSSSLQIQPADASYGGNVFAFEGDGVNDILYTRNFRIIELGVVECIDLSVSGATKTDLKGSNNGTAGANTEAAI